MTFAVTGVAIRDRTLVLPGDVRSLTAWTLELALEP
jgi:hypothetical protein